MRKLIIAAGAVTLLAAAPLPALAEEAAGLIQNIDAAARSITLADGSTYVLPEGVNLASLEVGTNVVVMYTLDATGKPMVTSVAPATAGETAPAAPPAQ